MIGKHVQNGFYLAMIYLIIAGNYLVHLFSCQIHALLNNYEWIKHLLGFFTSYFLVILANPPTNFTHKETVGFAAVLYAWFFLTTKMRLSFWIPMIVLVLGSYAIYLFLRDRRDEVDPTKTDSLALKLASIQEYSIFAAFVLTIVGVLVEWRGSRKSAYAFWLGRPVHVKSVVCSTVA